MAVPKNRRTTRVDTDAVQAGDVFGPWTVADPEIRIPSDRHKNGVRGLRFVCPNGHVYDVRRGNLKTDTWERYCRACPWECCYCGNTDPDDRRFVHSGRKDAMYSRCQRCDAPYLHGLPWEAYLAWLPGGCFICGSHERLHIDHDHGHCAGAKGCTECVRGLLCMTHNIVVGLIEHENLKYRSYLREPDELDLIRAYLTGGAA